MKNTVSIIKFISILNDESGQRIDNFLCTKFKNIPKSAIYRFLRKGIIRVNKKRIKPKYKLVAGDKIRIPPMSISIDRKKNISPYLKKISILNKVIIYEDEYILALNKPSGIAVHGGSGLVLSVIEGLRVLRPEVNFLELVHRLDRDTSGILLLAKKRSTLRSLHKQLRENKMYKEYLILVRGQWKTCIKTVKVPLLKNTLQNGKRIVQVNKNGKHSQTNFIVKERYKFATFMSCNPITGRTHQIRVHAQYHGHPIAFDNIYGDHEFDKKLLHTGLTRMFLHAASVKFVHPNTGKNFYIKAPLDKELKHCLRILRINQKYNLIL